MITEFKTKGNNYQRESYKGDFDEFILENIHNSDIENYAEDRLDMVPEDDQETSSISDYTERELLDELKESGYVLFKPKSIIEEAKIKEMIKIIQQ